MEIITQPAEYNLAGNIPDLVIAADSDISFKLYRGEELLLDETYSPDADGLVTIELREYLESILVVDLPSFGLETYHQANGYGEFTAEFEPEEEEEGSGSGSAGIPGSGSGSSGIPGSQSIAFFVVKGGVGSINSDQAFINSQFLTWQPAYKYVKRTDPEWLTYFAINATQIRAKAYFTPGGDETINLQLLPADQLTSFNLSYGILKEKFSSIDIARVEIWGEVGGQVVTIVQTLAYFSERFDYDDLFVFSNSLAGIDTIRFTGRRERIEDFITDKALFNRDTLEYHTEPNRRWNKNTGDFRSRRELLWARDFFASILKYHVRSGILHRIITESDNLSSVRHELSSYDFVFEESRQTLALLYQDYFEVSEEDAPQVPINLVAEALDPVTIRLTWDDNSNDESGFEVWFKEENDEDFILYDSTGPNATSINVDGLNPSTTYVFKVRSITIAYVGAFSNEVEATTLEFNSPTNLSATAVAITQIDLQWDDNSSIETAFQIERKIEAGDFVLIDTVGPNVESYSDMDVERDIEYTYRVRAISGELFSEYSNEAVVEIVVELAFTIRSSPANLSWNAVCWSPELGLFCAVALTGTGNRIMTSTDGINWVSQNSPADNNWTSVVWSPELGLFCAIATSGVGNRVMTSPNGIDWTLRSTPANNNWFGLCWSADLTLFCAVAITGTGNGIMTSPDGINWTTRTSPANNGWRSVCWAPLLSLFCAVAETGAGNRIMTSPDGITWNLRTTPQANNWNCVTWSPELGLFCAVSSTGSNRVMTSPDGIDWTLRVAASQDSWLWVEWSPELSIFCAVSQSGNGNRIMKSSDGINWETVSSPADNSWRSISWSPQLKRFCSVALTGEGDRVMTGELVLAENT